MATPHGEIDAGLSKLVELYPVKICFPYFDPCIRQAQSRQNLTQWGRKGSFSYSHTFIQIIIKWRISIYCLILFYIARNASFQKWKLHFPVKLRKIMASVKTVKLWGFKCLGYKEEGEVKILRRKILNLTRIKREVSALFLNS